MVMRAGSSEAEERHKGVKRRSRRTVRRECMFDLREM